MNERYQLGLLNLVHLLISADGVIDGNERSAVSRICEMENIPETLLRRFESDVQGMKERDIYSKGLELLSQCTEEEKLRAFVHLYKMSEVDGRVHVKEVRLLLYSIKLAGVEFDDVVKLAQKK
ncbi:MAG: hypothetical protein K1X47_04605 [Cyclobacteriaceae bacterium]|nr:hypothetical protein [Cyclobacteriaceae bacterium]